MQHLIKKKEKTTCPLIPKHPHSRKIVCITARQGVEETQEETSTYAEIIHTSEGRRSSEQSRHTSTPLPPLPRKVLVLVDNS